MTCERCIHYDICNEHADGQLLELAQGVCFRFKDKDRLVEVKQGWWNRYADYKFMGYGKDDRLKYRKVYTYECSKCGHNTAVKSNYCPSCGAKMDGERKDND